MFRCSKTLLQIIRYIVDPKKEIFNILEKTSTESYLKFLKFILSYVNRLNRTFQSEQSLVHELFNTMVKWAKTFLDFFVTRIVLKNAIITSQQ